jgi:RHS repeat-associated protein
LKTTTYCGNIIYEDGALSQILFDGGYATLDDDGIPQYHFYLRDHLGNNRVVARADGTIEQVNHYYPFGGLMGESTGGDEQRYKYNGKELDRMHGLDWFDYGARMYDGLRFTTMDPLAEDYYPYSPYAYCLNNPIRLIDIKGMAPGDFFRTPDAAAIDFGYCYNGASIIKNREYGTMIFQVVNSKNEIGYTYNIPTIGTYNGVAIDPAPAGYRVVATAHTHGKYVEPEREESKNFNDEFSGLRMNDDKGTVLPTKSLMARNDITDIGNANRCKLNNYVATPNGSLQKYDHKTGKISIISNDMPSDKNDPNRLNDRDASDTTSNNDLLQLIRKIIYQQY